MLIIDALQYTLSSEPSVAWNSRSTGSDVSKPKRAILTHMHTPLDYDTVMRETPEHVVPAYDQLQFEIELDELSET